MVTKQKDKRRMTFKEFWEQEKKGVNSETVEIEKQGILETLREQGFSEQQVNELKMEEVLELMFEATVKSMEEAKAVISHTKKHRNVPD